MILWQILCILPTSIQKLLFRLLWCGRVDYTVWCSGSCVLSGREVWPTPSLWLSGCGVGPQSLPFQMSQILLLLTWSPPFWVSPVWYMFSILLYKAVQNFLRWNIIVTKGNRIKPDAVVRCWDSRLPTLPTCLKPSADLERTWIS